MYYRWVIQFLSWLNFNFHLPPSLLSLFPLTIYILHLFPQIFLFPPNFNSHTIVSLLFYPSFLTSPSGLPQIPPGRRITCHRWRRLPPTMTNTWPRQGVVPPLRTLLLLCCFLTGQRSSRTTPPATDHNAFQWPVTQTCLWTIQRNNTAARTETYIEPFCKNNSTSYDIFYATLHFIRENVS